MKTLALKFLFFLLISTALSAQEFVNPIQIPPLIKDDAYQLNVIETQHNFNPMGTGPLNTMVPTFAFEDAKNPGTTSILGPTLTWGFQRQLTPTVTNMLNEVTTCHWHGAHVPQFADGGPHQRIMPGDTWRPAFEVKDKSATMWYHPHAMGLTYEHVQMGLSGMIIVEDPVNDPILSFLHDVLPTDYGVDDFPLIFQTKKFNVDDSTGQVTIQAEQGFKKDYEYMVNGIIDPVLELPNGMIRLRLLNGDGKFSFNLAFTDEAGDPIPAQMLATDAGYMTRTHQLPEILMAPGERTEWLLDLRGTTVGTVLYVRNNVSRLPDGIIGNSTTTQGYAVDRNLLKLVVVDRPLPSSPIIAFPINLLPSEQPPISQVSRERLKTFRQDTFIVDGDTLNLFNIDSVLMNMMVVNDVVRLDSTELWTIDNKTGIGHPWHIHDIHFWVTKITDANGIDLEPGDYPELFDGPKDNVLVQPGWKVSYITTFSDYGTEIQFDSSYMYHCHILPHEDRGMMGQFVVWNGLGDPPTSVADPEVSTIAMTVFPNPARDLLYLDGTSSGPSTLRFFDLQGRLVHQMLLPAFDGAIELDSAPLPPGMLVMDWQTKEGRALTKVVIQR
ncbi:MAG: multicopper oxidase domain-containing protein [Bacteroidota bacterium]